MGSLYDFVIQKNTKYHFHILFLSKYYNTKTVIFHVSVHVCAHVFIIYLSKVTFVKVLTLDTHENIGLGRSLVPSCHFHFLLRPKPFPIQLLVTSSLVFITFCFYTYLKFAYECALHVKQPEQLKNPRPVSLANYSSTLAYYSSTWILCYSGTWIAYYYSTWIVCYGYEYEYE